MRLSGEYTVTAALGPQPSRVVARTQPNLGAFIKVDQRPTEIRIELHLYVDSTAPGLLGDLKFPTQSHPDIRALHNWLKQLSWKSLAVALNRQQAWSEDMGGFTLKVEKEFDLLILKLVNHLKA